MSTSTRRRNGGAAKRERKPNKAQIRARRGRSSRRGLGPGAKVGIAVVLGIAVLGTVFYFNNRDGSDEGGSGKYAFEVGSPGPGEEAPEIQLPSTKGGTFELSALQGKTVLLYFQEGLMCQPCWDQLKDVEKQWTKFQQLGMDEIVTITTDPLNGLKQKVADEGIESALLSDERRQVSEAYSTAGYGMMGGNFNGHSFIVVGTDGKIEWRADYGGPPKYHMYIDISSLLADMRKGLKSGEAS